MKAIYKLFAAIALTASALPALAHHDHHALGERIDHRIDQQARDIQYAFRQGDLTKRERKRMRHELRHLRSTLDAYRGDGYLSHKERRSMRNEIRKDRELLARLRSNDRRRGHHDHKRHKGYRDHSPWFGYYPEYSYDYGRRQHRHRHHDGGYLLFGFEL